MFLGRRARQVRKADTQPPVSRLSRQSGILNISQHYRTTRLVTGIALTVQRPAMQRIFQWLAENRAVAQVTWSIYLALGSIVSSRKISCEIGSGHSDIQAGYQGSFGFLLLITIISTIINHWCLRCESSDQAAGHRISQGLYRRSGTWLAVERETQFTWASIWTADSLKLWCLHRELADIRGWR
jgi:hypothetical protein